MKTNVALLLILFFCSNCSSQVKTDETAVKKIVTVTEYLRLGSCPHEPLANIFAISWLAGFHCSALVLNFNNLFSISSGLGRGNANSQPA